MIIYRALNRLTGEKYIGKTIKPLWKRRSDHKYEAFTRKRNSKFYVALREYGWENFEWEILAHSNTYKNLKILERKYIIEESAIEHGYNTQIR